MESFEDIPAEERALQFVQDAQNNLARLEGVSVEITDPSTDATYSLANVETYLDEAEKILERAVAEQAFGHLVQSAKVRKHIEEMDAEIGVLRLTLEAANEDKIALEAQRDDLLAKVNNLTRCNDNQFKMINELKDGPQRERRQIEELEEQLRITERQRNEYREKLLAARETTAPALNEHLQEENVGLKTSLKPCQEALEARAHYHKNTLAQAVQELGVARRELEFYRAQHEDDAKLIEALRNFARALNEKGARANKSLGKTRAMLHNSKERELALRQQLRNR